MPSIENVTSNLNRSGLIDFFTPSENKSAPSYFLIFHQKSLVIIYRYHGTQRQDRRKFSNALFLWPRKNSYPGIFGVNGEEFWLCHQLKTKRKPLLVRVEKAEL